MQLQRPFRLRRRLDAMNHGVPVFAIYATLLVAKLSVCRAFATLFVAWPTETQPEARKWLDVLRRVRGYPTSVSFNVDGRRYLRLSIPN